MVYTGSPLLKQIRRLEKYTKPRKVREIKPPDLSNVTDLAEFRARPKTEGKEPPTGPDWLSGMKLGSEFLTRDKGGLLTPRFLVLEWIMGGLHPTGNVLLIPAKTPNDPKTWQWVAPKEFCQMYEFRGIIKEYTDEELENDPSSET